MAKSSRLVIDKKTGKKRLKDMKRSRAAKKGARKRKGKPVKSIIKMKIRKALIKTNRTGRTKAGRRKLKAKR